MSTAQKIFDDLLNIEVNTIVKRQMTARKMPVIQHALLDVLGTYDNFLIEVERMIGSTSHEVEKRVSLRAFDSMRERAFGLEDAYRAWAVDNRSQDTGVETILKRVYRNCDQIKGILAGKKVSAALPAGGLDRTSEVIDLPLTAEEKLIVRKVWEIGTEEVVIQTVVQIDGDIVTRIQQARVSAANEPVHTLHQTTLERALDHWQMLFQTLAQLTSEVFRGFLGR